MNAAVVVIFALVYLGMFLGELPGLALDRTGVALLGAIAVVALGRSPIDRAWAAVDMRTIALLFAMMVISAQFRLAGFYTRVARQLVVARASPASLLALVVAAAGLLSAVLTNDIVCLAMTPVLVEGCAQRKLDPLPFLLALACAANVGSAGTLIGNPQNILIGQALHLSFRGYLLDAGVPALLGLAVTWAVIAFQYRGRWQREIPPPQIHAPPFDRWQSTKGLLVTAALMGAFLFAHRLPREGVALVCAGVLLLSRRMASREMMSLVDWQLLVLFIGLFIVNDAFEQTGMAERAVDLLRAVQHRLERAGDDVVAAARDAPDGGRDPRSRQHVRRQPDHRRIDREHHRRHGGAPAGRHDRLQDPRAHGRAGDRRDAGHRRPLAGAAGVTTAADPG
jgi:Na+/H+ antiporter NhaD/arsenite permease-like protein